MNATVLEAGAGVAVPTAGEAQDSGKLGEKFRKVENKMFAEVVIPADTELQRQQHGKLDNSRDILARGG